MDMSIEIDISLVEVLVVIMVGWFRSHCKDQVVDLHVLWILVNGCQVILIEVPQLILLDKVVFLVYLHLFFRLFKALEDVLKMMSLAI